MCMGGFLSKKRTGGEKGVEDAATMRAMDTVAFLPSGPRNYVLSTTRALRSACAASRAAASLTEGCPCSAARWPRVGHGHRRQLRGAVPVQRPATLCGQLQKAASSALASMLASTATSASVPPATPGLLQALLHRGQGVPGRSPGQWQGQGPLARMIGLLPQTWLRPWWRLQSGPWAGGTPPGARPSRTRGCRAHQHG